MMKVENSFPLLFWGSIWQSFLNFVLFIPEPQDGFSHIEILNSCPILHPSFVHKGKQPAGFADALFLRGEGGKTFPVCWEGIVNYPERDFPVVH